MNKFGHKPFPEFQIISTGQTPRTAIVRSEGKIYSKSAGIYCQHAFERGYIHRIYTQVHAHQPCKKEYDLISFCI